MVQARGGSKGLPRKNVRLLDGHPLVAYSVASGRAARSVSRLIVSTDDEEIAEIARQYGAEAPFMRPRNLAEDDTPDFPVFEHALAWLAEHEDYRPEIVVQLRPTTPFRPRGMIDQAVDILLADAEADCVRGVTEPKQTPYKMWRPGPHGTLLPLMETGFAEPYNMPRQLLPQAWWQTGHIDAIRTRTIVEGGSLTGKRVRPILIDNKYCVDIDTLADFDLAERACAQKQLDIDVPQPIGGGGPVRAWPPQIALLVFDFDGVFTDNRVMVFDDGREAVLCNRGDGMGLSLLRKAGLPMVVLSTEENTVVAARCHKLELEYYQGLADKRTALVQLAAERNIPLEQVVYVGNDINDLACMNAVGFSIAVADAHAMVLSQADLVLANPGGQGAVREVCDSLLQHLSRKQEHAAGG